MRFVQGFAFINFHRREDAARAIAGVSGFGYDHLILNVEWAKWVLLPVASLSSSSSAASTETHIALSLCGVSPFYFPFLVPAGLFQLHASAKDPVAESPQECGVLINSRNAVSSISDQINLFKRQSSVCASVCVNYINY